MVSRTRISSRTGMAAMFDALIFLTAVSVVAVAAVLLSVHPAETDDAQVQELVDRTHAMLCRMTFQPPDQENLGPNGSGAPLMTIGTVSLGLFQEAREKAFMPSWLNSTISDVLRRILEPRFCFVWKLSDGRSEMSMQPGPPLPMDGDVFVSFMDLGGRPPVRSALYIWPSR